VYNHGFGSARPLGESVVSLPSPIKHTAACRPFLLAYGSCLDRAEPLALFPIASCLNVPYHSENRMPRKESLVDILVRRPLGEELSV